MELIARIIVGGLMATLALADMISLIWMDEPFKEPPDNINAESDGD
jgi:hypothetical protein